MTVKCNDVLCSWVGRRADHSAHWKAACPVRGTRQGRFTAFYGLSVLENNESDNETPIIESCESSLSARSLQLTSFPSSSDDGRREDNRGPNDEASITSV